MSDLTPSTHESASEEPLLDTILREAVPEIKLSLGDLIDRDNQRAIPDRYARMLPEGFLVVTLRPDAAAAVQPIAAELERELTDSCMRHGSLYDRQYRVQLREAASPGAPLFRVSTGRAGEPAPQPASAPRAAPGPASGGGETVMASAPSGPSATVLAGGGETVHAPPPSPPARPARPAGPSEDPDATRLEGIGPPPSPAPRPSADPAAPRWDAGRWELVVESEDGDERERFPIPAPMSTVGRQTENPDLRSDVAITDAPHVSRRQLALVWAPRGEKNGFTVYNLGLNPLHVEGKEIAGANQGKGPLELDALMLGHTEWVGPDTPMKIGEHGPVLRIVESGGAAKADDGPPIDPDATRFG